ncbi:MAG: gamma-glutamylcyclotransferase family protein [Pseudomonadota bacterium]
MLYFAYGSNMLTSRLRARCPGATPVGRGAVRGHRVELTKRGRDGSGKATLVAGTGHVEGVLFRIPDGEWHALDEAEGLGRGYDHCRLQVEQTRGEGQAALSYIASAPVAGLPVFDWYLALMRAGAAEHGLPAEVRRWLRAQPSVRDPEPERPQRREALRALSEAGYGNLVV